MIVIKIGGSEGIDLDAVAADTAALIASGQQLVIVHGGSHGTNTLAEQLGHPPQFITSPSGHTSRRTDRRTLDIFRMACASLNMAIVERLRRLGVNALGLSGIDGGLWTGARKEAVRSVEDGRVVVIRDDFTGTVDRVNADLLRTLLAAGYVPVISPPGLSEKGEPINVDADRAAAATAAALGAESLLLLSNVRGLLREFPDESTLIHRVARAEIELAAQAAQGRMKKKVLGAGEALSQGVHRVIIGDARIPSPISGALAGAGTTFQ